MLEITDVTVRYGDTTAVDDVSLSSRPARCWRCSGLRLREVDPAPAVAGLEPLFRGSVAWDGTDLGGTPTHRRGFALMFQDGQLLPT